MECVEECIAYSKIWSIYGHTVLYPIMIMANGIRNVDDIDRMMISSTDLWPVLGPKVM